MTHLMFSDRFCSLNRSISLSQGPPPSPRIAIAIVECCSAPRFTHSTRFNSNSKSTRISLNRCFTEACLANQQAQSSKFIGQLVNLQMSSIAIDGCLVKVNMGIRWSKLIAARIIVQSLSDDKLALEVTPRSLWGH